MKTSESSLALKASPLGAFGGIQPWMKMLLVLGVAVVLLSFAPEALATGGDVGMFGGGAGTTGTGAAKWSTFQQHIKGFAIILLLIAVVIAAIMAAFQQVKYALNVAIGGIILFGGTYLLVVLYEGFK